MKEQDLRDKIVESIDQFDDLVLSKTDAVNQCVQIAIDYAREEAIGFSEWLISKCDYSVHGVWSYQWMEFTQKELYEIYLTTKTLNK